MKKQMIAVIMNLLLILSMTSCGNFVSYETDEIDKADEEDSEYTEQSDSENDIVTAEEIAEAGNYLENLDLEVWDGSVADSYAGGSGTEDDPWQISNGAELALMAQDINDNINNDSYYILTSDILLNDLSDWEDWTESPPSNIFEGIGDTSYPEKYFSGEFNGQGHYIYGMYSETGMFPTVRSAVIKNVNIEASVVNASEGDHAGGFVGEVDGNYGMELRNCSFNGIVRGDNFSSCGGLIGVVSVTNNFSDTEFLVQYCKNYASVDGYNAAGGIIGELGTEGINPNVLYCENYGDVTAYKNAGGIVGILSNGMFTGNTSTVRSCRNTGTITAEAGLGAAGGIAGSVSCGVSDMITISSCVNTNSGGVIDSYTVSSGGTLALNTCYYRSGSSAYDQAQKSAIYGTLNETGLEALSESEFRENGQPLLPDAEEALETGEYIKYDGKIYYIGFSKRLFSSDYAGSHEQEIATLSYDEDLYRYENYLCYLTYDSDSYLYSLILYDLDNGEETYIEKDFDGYLCGVHDGTAYYGMGWDNIVYTYAIETGQKETITLDEIVGDFGSVMMSDQWLSVNSTTYDIDTGEANYSFYFWDFDGNLIIEKTAEDFGEDVYTTLLDGELWIYDEGMFSMYDPDSDSLINQVSYEMSDMLGIQSVDDDYIYVYTENGDVEAVSR